MKIRFWVAFPVAAALIVMGAYLDWSWLAHSRQANSTQSSAFEIPIDQLLHACESSPLSYTGPLVPTQNMPVPSISLGEIEPAGAIPQAAWSTRAGFSISYTTDPTYWAQLLGSGWYLDWSVQSEPQIEGPQHWQMVRVHQDCISPSPRAIQAAAKANPGQVWIIGNEPDVIWQDNVTPERYAVYYHALYRLIKLSDPSSLIAVGGISQATPLRLQYLDQVLQTYRNLYGQPLPADWWTVHGYVLREQKGSWGVEIPPGIDTTQGMLYEISDHGRLDLFEDQVFKFRQWMKENGYQDTPLALTEFGILMPISYGFPVEAIADYLTQSFTWLYQAQDEQVGNPEDNYQLVQKWAWFSITDPGYSSSNLGELSTGTLTPIGERFRSVVSTKGQ